MPLLLSIGHATLVGLREANEDFGGFVTPTAETLAAKGAVAALADGVGGGIRGRDAAEAAVRGLLSDYYATPDAWPVNRALDKVLTAVNSWIHSRGRPAHGHVGMATTLAAMVLRGRRFYTAHAGDTRIYRLRKGQLTLLSTDHVWDLPEMSHVLKRAFGLDEHIIIDFGEGELETGDLFLLATDGVWEPLGDKRIRDILLHHGDSQQAADALAAAAIEHGGRDNASALLIRVDDLPEDDFNDFNAISRRLPLPPRLKAGAVIDGFEVLDLLHDSRATLLYRVRQPETGQILVLKTLQALLGEDSVSCAGLLAEEWLAKRVLSHYFPQIVPLSAERRRHLYYVMTWHEGATLEQQLAAGQHFTVPDVVGIGIRLTKALAALHRLNIIHRDVKPANVHLGSDSRLRLLDLGVALERGARDDSPVTRAGTPSYLAPELFADGQPGRQSDVYATGVTLYYALTGHYPYGEVEPFQTPAFVDPVPPTRYRPDIPQWLENLLLRAVAREPKRRFETAEELLLALERGDYKPVTAPGRTPLAQRSPLKTWQLVALISLVLNFLLLYVLVLR